MSTKKQLLFSKKEKVDKSTSTGEESKKVGGVLGVPQNNNQESNTQKKESNEHKPIKELLMNIYHLRID